eukprot:jgi/Psemu1/15951/gm1.15951_g
MLDRWLILRPTFDGTLDVDVDVDVDAAFTHGWRTEEGTKNPGSVKSCTGYPIEIEEIAGCPILWVSKLQSTIATTSTMESEYTALSTMALGAAIPLLVATVDEDNQGALILANLLEPGRHTADFLTKPLGPTALANNQKVSMGWYPLSNTILLRGRISQSNHQCRELGKNDPHESLLKKISTHSKECMRVDPLNNIDPSCKLTI